MRVCCASIVLLALAGAALPAAADTIYLRNGRQYTGVFVSGNKDRIRFNTGARVVRVFRTRDVDHLQFGGAIPRSTPQAQTTPRSTPKQTAAPYAQGGPSEATPPVPATTPRATARQGTPAQTPGQDMPAATPPGTPVGTTDDAGAIDSAYTGIGADTGVLGPPIAPQQPTQDGRALVRIYRNGAIYWTPQGGAHAIYGPLRDAWVRAGGERSRLGYPTSDEQDTNAGYNRLQYFQHGSISWDQQQGARVHIGPGGP